MSLATLVTAPAQTVYVSGAAYLGGVLMAALPITAGSVTADARRSLTRDGSIELAPDSGLSHEELYDLLATPGIEVTIERGFVLPPGRAYTDNIIPVMTSATAPSGVASSNSDFDVSLASWKAFNHANAAQADGWWTTGGGTGWVQYQFPAPRVITRYAVTSSINYAAYAPKSWTFKGSNDGSTWVTLDTQTNVTSWATPLERKVFDFANTTAYAYGRLYITAGNDASYVGVGELEMMETVALDGARVGAPLGRFVVDELTLKRTPGGTTLSATLSDLSRRVSRARWADPYQVAAGASVADAINAILADRAPTLATRIIDANTPGTLGAPVTFEGGESSDPWASAGEIARAFGYDLATDATGAAVTIPEPMLDPAAAVFSFARGSTAIRTDESRVTPLQRTYNGVIVSGEGPDLDTPVRGEAWDANPASATYYLGPFGKVPMFYSSPLISSADQATAAARTRLAGVLGRVEQLSWSQLVHPGLVPLDVVTVEDAAGGLMPYILDAITIPLSVDGAASAVAREIVIAY